MKKSNIFNPKLVAEADAVGLVLIGEGSRTSADYRKYKFLSCQHEEEIHTGCVRTNCFKCQTCFQKMLKEKLKNEAEAAGLELIGTGKSRRYRKYKFLSCQHELQIYISNVRRKDFSCTTCFQERIEKDAERAGLVFLGAAKKSSHRKYKFVSCQHEQELAPCRVQENDFKCSACLQNKLRNEAGIVGLMLLGYGKTRGSRRYKFKSCSHEQDIQRGNVRKNTFICQQCEETGRTLPSCVYLLRITLDEFSWLKLGHSRKIQNRIYHYNLLKGAQVEILKVAEFDTGNEAHAFESEIHRNQGREKLCKKLMKKYHQRNGQTECYPLHMRATLEAIILAQANQSIIGNKA